MKRVEIVGLQLLEVLRLRERAVFNLQNLLMHRLQLMHSVLGIEWHKKVEIFGKICQTLLHLLESMPLQVGPLVQAEQLSLVESVVLDRIPEMTQVFNFNFEILVVEGLVNVSFRVVGASRRADAELAVELRHSFGYRVDQLSMSDDLHAHRTVGLALVVSQEAWVALKMAAGH